MAPAHRIALSLFIGLTLVAGLSYADAVQTDYVTFFEKERYEDRLYFRLLADKDRCVVIRNTRNKPGAVEKKLVTDLTPPCRFVRSLNEIIFHSYPKKGTVVLISGAPASREYIETHWVDSGDSSKLSPLDQCSSEEQALIVKTSEHYFLSKKQSGVRSCPWFGTDEKNYYDYAYDRIR